jgi:hypothetical protein
LDELNEKAGARGECRHGNKADACEDCARDQDGYQAMAEYDAAVERGEIQQGEPQTDLF